MILASSGTVSAALPVALLGALAPLITAEIPVTPTALGALAAAYFAAGATVSVPASAAVARFGPTRALSAAAAAIGAGLSSVLFVANIWQLAAVMIFTGVAAAAVQLSLNQIIALRTSARRLGLVYGLKQAAVPLATMLSGIAVPTVAAHLGWRGVFLGSAFFPLVVVFRARRYSTEAPESDAGRIPVRALTLLSVAAGLASAAGNSLSPFVVQFALYRGFDFHLAELTLVVGAASGVATRIGTGWAADTIGSGSLLLMAALLGLGAVGMSALAFADNPGLLVIAASVSFCGAWGWNGLLLLAVARMSSGAVARPMGIVTLGPLIGAVVGPLMFGYAADEVSFAFAWVGASLVAATSGLVVLAGRRRLRARIAVLAPVGGNVSRAEAFAKR